jgi:hypothetical protein
MISKCLCIAERRGKKREQQDQEKFVHGQIKRLVCERITERGA